MGTAQKLVWHYLPATIDQLHAVNLAGVILPASEVSYYDRASYRKVTRSLLPAVRFSTDQDLDASAFVDNDFAKRIPIHQSLPMAGRIGILPDDLCTWGDYKSRCLSVPGLSEQDRESLATFFAGMREYWRNQNIASDSAWFVSLAPVLKIDWKAVEFYSNGAWTSLR